MNVGILVIGYGNTLRRDDGVGVKIAEAVAKMNLPGVKIVTSHQLVPELAEIISQAQRVIFVDASAEIVGSSELKPVEPAVAGQILAHAVNPASLLALSKQLFGRSPQAWILAVPAEDFGFGDGLSLRARAASRIAVNQIRDLAQNKFCEAVGNAG